VRITRTFCGERLRTQYYYESFSYDSLVMEAKIVDWVLLTGFVSLVFWFGIHNVP
jgi:hypothetical protein